MKHVETDISFLKQLNARQHEAFKVLFKDYYQDLAYYSCKILKDPIAAEDIAQDVFIRLWEKENHFENHLALKSYLYLSARNNCLNYLRHHQIVSEFENKLPEETSGRINLEHDCRIGDYQYSLGIYQSTSSRMQKNHGIRFAGIQ